MGSILVGGVHDFAALVASIRHKGRTIANVVRDHMTPRAYLLFLSFIWLALIYIIVAFTDVTAASFVGQQKLENGEIVSGGGIATSSMIYLALPIIMGLLLKFTKLSLGIATVIFLPLVLLAIWAGQHIPLDLASIFGTTDAQAQKLWGIGILLYCVIAAVMPMWLLLQPRGHLGGYFLYFFLATGVLGLLFGGYTATYPAFTGWMGKDGSTLAPFLFIMIACGAVSGFHSLIASGTTSKQLKKETDAKPIGYGTMLLEAGVAFISLSTVMVLTQGNPIAGKAPPFIFADGLSNSLTIIGVSKALAMATMMLAFTTFVYDTLDVCTRLGRYIIQEFTGWHNAKGAWLGTGLTVLAPVYFLIQQPLGPDGKPIPTYRVFWNLFGASNQLLAALTLLGITVWLWNTRRAKWALLVTGVPCLFMYGMSCWALSSILLKAYNAGGFTAEATVGLILLFFAAWMFIEGVITFARPKPQPPMQPEPVPA